MARHEEVGKPGQKETDRPGRSIGAERDSRADRSAKAGRGRGGAHKAAPAGSGTAFDRADLAGALAAGLADLGLSLDESQREQLIDYLALLSRWNAVYNLTAVRDPQAMLVQHLLDSLAIVPPLAARGPFGCLVDVGSGGGLPGIVLAIVWAQAIVHLVEPVGKKAAFLRQCASELGLAGLRVHATRIESLAERRELVPDLVVCRAFASLSDFVAGIDGLVGPGTIVAAMKGKLPSDEIVSLPNHWRVQQALPLAVPRLDAERHLLLLERNFEPTH